MAAIRRALAWLFLTGAVFLLKSCSGNGETIRHGTLSYNVVEIFDAEPRVLALARAAGRGDIREIKRLASLGVNPNSEGKSGITPLWWAAWADNYDGFRALLEFGADPNAVPATGPSVMIVIAELNQPKFLRAALNHGGNPNISDNDSGNTPLLRTVLLGRSEQTKMLLDAGADINVQRPITGATLPMIAIGASGDYELVYDLLQRGADYRLKTAAGRDLAYFISSRAIAPNSEAYIWREKVMEFLRSKGVLVERPSHETPRK